MRLSTRQHGILDYFTAILLLASPWLFGFSERHIEANMAIGAGVGLLLLSAMTDYELSLLRFIPFKVHRAADLLLGILLGGAPIHFAIGGTPAIVFVTAGIIELAGAFFTRPLHEDGNPIVPGS